MKDNVKNFTAQCMDGMDFLSNKFKRTFILRFLTVVVLGAAISGAVVYMMSSSTVTTTFEGSRLKIVSTADYILPAVLISSAVVIAFVGIAAIVLIVLVWYHLKMSMCVIEEDIEQADTGNLKTTVHDPKKKEEFQALSDALKKMLDHFSGTISRVKVDAEELEADMKAMEESGEKVPNKMKEELRKLKEELDKFAL